MNARRWSLVSSSLLLGALVASCAVEGDNAPVEGEGPVSTTRARLIGADAPEAIADQYIVVFKAGTARSKVDAAAGRAAARGAGRVMHSYAIIPGFAARLDRAEVEDLLDNPEVDYIEQDQTMHASATFPSPADGIDRVDQRQGRDGQYNDFGCNGTGVDVYIVDTGIRSTHNEFTGRMGNGFSAINDGRGSEDCNGHGTHVASTAAGTQFGMAKKATLHASRVLACNGSGSNAGVIAGVDFVRTDCTSKGRRCVANMSLGGGASQALDNAVTAAVNAGITFAVAA
ncbi:MAG: S8 family serine peptidase, partial [Polyangiaceae bacterium]|nr:S8 family serine peptidase [Polyangiaceae bacterium]